LLRNIKVVDTNLILRCSLGDGKLVIIPVRTMKKTKIIYRKAF